MTSWDFINENWHKLDQDTRDEFTARRQKEREAMSPEMLIQQRREAYVAHHQAMVQAIRAEEALAVQASLTNENLTSLGCSLVEWMYNREVDRRTLARLPGEAYGSLMYSGAKDARGSWDYDRELREIILDVFPESKPIPTTVDYQEPQP